MAQLDSHISSVVAQFAMYGFDYFADRQWAVRQGERKFWSFRESLLDDSATAHVTIEDRRVKQRIAEPVTIRRSYADMDMGRASLVQRVAIEIENAITRAEIEWAVYWSGNLWC